MARKDAERNRAKLIDAGREVFTEQGPDASLEEVARRAGVGIGTLYRHFPSRDALIEAVYASHIDELLAAAEEAASAEDPWGGLARYLEQVLEMQSRNLPLRGAFLGQQPSSQVVERRLRILPLLEQVIARAKEQGTLRSDYTVGDLSFALWSFAPVIEATSGVAPEAWRRHFQIVLDGMRADGATAQQAKPLTRTQLERAIEALRGMYHRRRAAA